MAISGSFKSYFLRGLAALLPTILTIWIIIQGYLFIQHYIGFYINKGIVWAILFFQGEQGFWTRDALEQFWVEGAGSFAGFIIALVSVCAVGVILASVVGRALWHTIEKFIMNTPVLRRVYPYVKQVTDFLLTKERLAFSRVVAVEYPRKGIWSMGLVTGSGLKGVAKRSKSPLLTILIPNSPTPFTGFIIMVPKDDVIELDITVEEAFRFAISGGVVTPGQGEKPIKITGYDIQEHEK